MRVLLGQETRLQTHQDEADALERIAEDIRRREVSTRSDLEEVKDEECLGGDGVEFEGDESGYDANISLWRVALKVGGPLCNSSS